ncbi:succinylglutamate desuccinylase/aspartoacylase domain-containing protein [Thalassotalea profundi]|nr:succinylglutamate desuccinylase/aspartoacylase family protein [Thalassotalea profundi]
MDIDFSEVTYLKNPCALTLKADYQQFLLSLSGPTIIDISGINNESCRVITTLLHGNEPSGLIAIHRWLTEHSALPVPETNIRIIICSVEAACKSPLLSHRYYPNGLDINRCFNTNETTGYFQRAQIIKQAILEVNPECVIDLHNTPGSGPAFAVCTIITPEVLSLTSLFCDTIILSSLKIGGLMEQNFNCPILTIECGSAHDEQSHETAYQGINQLGNCSSIYHYNQKTDVDIISKPFRFQLKPNVNLSYSEHDEGYEGVTLKSSIEQFNFGHARKDQMIGWVDDRGLDNFQLLNDAYEDVLNEYFTLRDNQLVCATNIRIFMATSNKEVATDDCLFYLVKSHY